MSLLLAGLLTASLNVFAQADTTPPAIASVSPPAGLSTNLGQVHVTFSEAVTNILAEDLRVNGIPAHSLIATNEGYLFLFDRLTYGSVQITWDAGHGITDLATPPNRFNENGAGATWSYTYLDTTPPEMTAITPSPDATVRKLNQIEITFSEPVAGVQADDLLINSVPASGLSVLGPGSFRFTFTQPATGVVQVAWRNMHGITDFAATPNAFDGGNWNLMLNPQYGLATIRINEFLAGNESAIGYKDEDGALEDWVELYNYGTSPVNLAGYALTDSLNDPGRWVFPSSILNPGQYLVVHASGKDRKSGIRLHTNFRLNLNSDYLGLFNAESPREALSEFNPKYPEQRNDYSYGISPSGAWKYFADPTPGSANPDSAITGVTPPPHVNVARGLFETPFTLILAPPLSGATLRYTTDGSQPTENHGATYAAPLQITNTTVLRVMATYPNLLPSKVASHTYLFPGRVLRQNNSPTGYPVGSTAWTGFPSDYEMDPEIVTNAAYVEAMTNALKALPTLSVTMSIDDLFGAANGIYTHPEPTDAQRYLWERACSVELILTNGATAFQVDCGIRMQGNASRTPQKTPKHPFRLMFKGKYGTGNLDYPVYEDSPVRSFDTLVLRADFNNSWTHWDGGQRTRGTRIRDAWAKQAARDMGMLAGHTRHFHLYLNGLYWGVYDFGERVDANFAASYLGGQPEEYDAIASKPTEAIDGDITAYNAMVAIGRSQSMASLANYNSLTQRLDLVQFIDYMLLNFYGANQDWGSDGNWNAVRKRAADGKFKYTVWDGEQLLVDPTQNRLTSADLPSGLHTNLVNSPEYKLAFADRVHKHMFNGGALTIAANLQRWQAYTQLLYLPIIAESARWGDYRRDVHQYSSAPYSLYTRNDFWVPEMTRMTGTYFPQRHDVFLTQLRTAGLYPANHAPSFNQHGGRVAQGFMLQIINNAVGGTVYYTTNGLDPRVYGTGVIEPTAVAYTGPVAFSASTVVKARHYTGTAWSALNEAPFTIEQLGLPLQITEIMFNPVGGDAYEFIEIVNAGGTPVDLSYLALSGVDYTFPVGRVLVPGEMFLVASGLSSNAFAARYPGVKVDGYFGGNLSNGGQRLGIVDQRTLTAGNVFFVNYDDANGWPKEADGGGYSLEFIHRQGDPNDPVNWRASAAPNGSPRSLSAAPATGSVLLNEVMAANASTLTNAGTLPDWIELRNAGPGAANLENWSLSDGGNARKYVFPAGTTLAAGGYLLVYCDTNIALPGLHTGFNLDREGENLFLYDASTNRADAVALGLQIYDFSVGRLGAGGPWQLNVPTPGHANEAAALAAATNLVINEWLANASAGGADWLELYNPSPTLPVSLQGIYLSHATTTYRLNHLSFISPRGYELLWADENPGAKSVNFKLAAAGGQIVLSDASGLEVNRVGYSPQAEGVSSGRLPDGSANLVAFRNSSSPGSTNYLAVNTGPQLHEILAVNQSVVTNSQYRTADFIELFNPLATAFDLSGMGLSDDMARPLQWVFPAGTTIPAGGYLAVWCDSGRRATTSTGAFLNTGYGLSGEGDTVVLANAAGQIVDAVTFGSQAPDFSIGLVAGQWRLLAAPTPGSGTATAATLGDPVNLRLNEWMASPAAGDDWVELFNPNALPVSLSGLRLADSPAVVNPNEHVIPSLSFIGPGRHALFHASGSPAKGPSHLPFALGAEGDSLRLSTADGRLADAIYFGGQLPDVAEGRLPDGAGAVVRFLASPTPGTANYLALNAVAINEVLTHTDAPLEDAVELINLSPNAVNLSGWYLSDNEFEPKKFRIPDGTTLPASGFKVFYQYQFDAGAKAFALSSAYGTEVWLSQADPAGNLSGMRARAFVGPMANGISAGRVQTSMAVEYAPLQARTLGQDNPVNLTQFRSGAGLPNAQPLVGPVVLNEIMYAPPMLQTNDDLVALEYVELLNNSTNEVGLYDAAHPANTWRLRGGIEFDFAPGTILPRRSCLLVVGFDPLVEVAAKAAFLTRYGLPANTPMTGPWLGRLENAGERVELLRPDNPQGSGPDEGYVPYLLVEAVHYGPAAPWAADANAAGASLQRFWPAKYANEPVNWHALVPTPNRANVPAYAAGDADGDGLPDAYEDAFGFARNNPGDGDQDADQDGFTNYDEFLLGTDPRSAGSQLTAPVITAQPTNLFVVAGQTALFAVVAGDPASANYQWFADDQPIAGANSSALILTNAPLMTGNRFRVAVLNVAGSLLSDPVYATFVIPPKSLAVTNGTTTNLAVTVNGLGNYTYQWWFNGLAMANATNAVLPLASVESPQAGSYSVVVRDGANIFESAPVNFQVLYRARFVQQPVTSVIAALGDQATFSVDASGTWPITYTWRRIGSPVSIMTLNANTATLVLTNVSASHAVFWDVVITNQVGVLGSPNSQRIYLNVITNPPRSKAVAPGSNVVLSAGLTGLQSLRFYQWHRDDQLMAGQTNQSLTLTNFQAADQGAYGLQVSTTNATYRCAPAWVTLFMNPVLRQSKFTVTGGFGLTVDGNPGLPYSVEASTDLITWSNLTTITITNPSVELQLPALDPNQTFYQLRRLP